MKKYLLPLCCNRFSIILVSFFLFIPFLTANAQIYPIVEVDGTDIWIGTENNLTLVSQNLWKYYTTQDGLPDNQINDIAVDETDVWVATASGLVQIDKGSRSFKIYDINNALPGDNVRAVDSDDDFVWVGTNNGLARYDKITRKWKTITKEGGLISNRVTRIIASGKNEVFISTREGLSVFHKGFKTWKNYNTSDGLPSDYIYEMKLSDEDIWLITDEGISRFNLRLRNFNSYTKENGLPSYEIRAFLLDGDSIWIGTDSGMVEYSSLSETVIPFVNSNGLFSQNITGMGVKDDSLWIGTDKGVCVFDKKRKSWVKYTKADNMTDDNISGVLVAGQKPVFITSGGMESYDIDRDEWQYYSYPEVDQAKQIEGTRMKWRFETLSNTEETFTFFKGKENSHDGFSTLDSTLGFGAVFPKGQSLDTSFRLDYGDLHTKGVKDYNYDFLYLGKKNDFFQEIRGSDLLLLKPENENMISRIGLEGGKIRTLMPGGKVKTEVAGGVRRGVYFKEFFQGEVETIYELSKKYIIPQTETVKVDGIVLERNIDYAIIYTTGYLAFLDEFSTNALSLIEISYEYDLKPKKKLGALSIIDLLPFDDEVSGFKRSGSYTLVKDESGLYAQIDGAAPKYLNRGWGESLFQDYGTQSISVKLQINDMGTEIDAAEIFSFDRPVSSTDISENVVLNEGLTEGYEIKMIMDNYYIEMSIDQKTDASRQLIILFALVVSDKQNAQGGTIDDLREAIASMRTAFNPNEKSEYAVNYAFTKSINNTDLAISPRSMHLGGIDTQNDFTIGGNSTLSAGTSIFGNRSEENANSSMSYGARGNLRFNNPKIVAKINGGYEGRNFKTIGTRQTYFGNTMDNVELNTRITPVSWLPISLFAAREESYISNATAPGNGVVKNYAGKISLDKELLPNISLSAARSDLGSPDESQGKLRLTGDFEYDFAKTLLKPIKIKKFFIKAFYDFTDLDLNETGTISSSRVFNSRYELKIAPTLTESGYAIYKDRYLKDKGSEPVFSDLYRVRELNFGGISTYIPGIVPSLNEQLVYTNDFTEEETGKKDVKASLTPGLDLFPGQWFSVLRELNFSNKYTYSTEERAIGDLKIGRDITHKIDLTGNYDSYRWVTATVQGIFTYKKTGQNLDPDETRKDLLTTFTVRPIFKMPIRLMYNMSKVTQPIDTVESKAKEYHPSIRWEMKWNRNLSTRVGLKLDFLQAENRFDAETATFQNYDQHATTPYSEVRHRIPKLWGGELISYYKFSYNMTNGSGQGSNVFHELFLSIGWIYILGSNIYADLTVEYTHHDCRGASSCDSFDRIEPKLIATMKF